MFLSSPRIASLIIFLQKICYLRQHWDFPLIYSKCFGAGTLDSWKSSRCLALTVLRETMKGAFDWYLLKVFYFGCCEQVKILRAHQQVADISLHTLHLLHSSTSVLPKRPYMAQSWHPIRFLLTSSCISVVLEWFQTPATLCSRPKPKLSGGKNGCSNCSQYTLINEAALWRRGRGVGGVWWCIPSTWDATSWNDMVCELRLSLLSYKQHVFIRHCHDQCSSEPTDGGTFLTCAGRCCKVLSTYPEMSD